MTHKQLPEWLRQVAEGEAMAEDWPNGEYPHAAFAARNIVAEKNDSSDAQVSLLQVVINEVEQRQTMIDALPELEAIVADRLPKAVRDAYREGMEDGRIGYCNEQTSRHKSDEDLWTYSRAKQMAADILKAEGKE